MPGVNRREDDMKKRNATKSIDLNADLGEGFGACPMGNDEEILKIITSTNVARGFHGGNPLVMHKTPALAGFTVRPMAEFVA